MTFRDFSNPRIRVGVILLASLILIAAFYQNCRGPDGVPSTVRDSVTALTVTKGSDSATHAAVATRAETVYRRSTAADPAVARLARTADSLRVVADSAAARARSSATASDSARQWQIAYGAEHRRADSLKAEVDTLTDQKRNALASARGFQSADSLSQSRLARVEALNASLVTALEHPKACRILPFVNCVSRRTSLAIGVVVGVVGVLAVHQLR